MNAWISRALNVGGQLVDWRSTAVLATMRSASAGLTWGIFALLGGSPEAFLQYTVGGPFVGLLFMIPLALVGLAASKVFPLAGLLGLVPLIYMVSGDPLLWLIERIRPGTVPIREFKPLNLKTILIVVDEGLVQGLKAEAATGAKVAGAEALRNLRKTGSAARSGNSEPASNSPAKKAGAVDTDPHQLQYDQSVAEFRRLASLGNQGEAMRAEMLKISALVTAGCRIPGPYVFSANVLVQTDLVENWNSILTILKSGYEACSGNRSHQEEIETAYFGLGKACWDLDREDLAFKAYMIGLNKWRAAGNIINQSSPLLPRIAFVASRMFSKNALERDNNTDMGSEFLDFCEASAVDINLDIDVSYAPRSS